MRITIKVWLASGFYYNLQLFPYYIRHSELKNL